MLTDCLDKVDMTIAVDWDVKPQTKQKEKWQNKVRSVKTMPTEKEWVSFVFLFEPPHDISNNVVCATSKASDQPAHMRSLIRAFACRLNIL